MQNEAIKLAIEKGGYNGHQRNWGASILRIVNDKHFVLLDPLFWQALGKALKWEEKVCKLHGHGSRCNEKSHDIGWPCNGNFCECENENITEWLFHWHRFIDSLATGEDVDKFFNDLLK